jgi:hypothetical protein
MLNAMTALLLSTIQPFPRMLHTPVCPSMSFHAGILGDVFLPARPHKHVDMARHHDRQIQPFSRRHLSPLRLLQPHPVSPRLSRRVHTRSDYLEMIKTVCVLLHFH